MGLHGSKANPRWEVGAGKEFEGIQESVEYIVYSPKTSFYFDTKKTLERMVLRTNIAFSASF
jgi:hypothetical protein